MTLQLAQAELAERNHPWWFVARYAGPSAL